MSEPSSARVELIVFVKAPRPGNVKTRLAEVIGAEPACAAYRELVTSLLHNLESLQSVELRFSPDSAVEEIVPWRKPAWKYRPQGGGDLGTRLRRAFDESFAEGPVRTVVIGADCPTVTAEDIHMAWQSLSSHDVVLGPAADGGYWLIGLRERHPELFDNIPWSTASVLAQTLDRIQQARLSVQLLRQQRDVDTEYDWREFLTTRDRDGINTGSPLSHPSSR